MQVTVKAERNHFALVVAQNRNMNPQHVYSYELDTLSWCLAISDGNSSKTVKSKMAGALDTKSPPTHLYPDRGAWVIDEMALLHSLRNINKTFGELASPLLFIVKKYSGETNITNINFVCESYHTTSFKYI